MQRHISRLAAIALSIAGSATLLFSCSDKGDPVRYDYETLLTESSENRTITMMENGHRSYIFTTPLIEGYSMATNPYQEFRRGIDMTTFTSDSLSLIDVTIKANYAIYYERQKLWEAKGNVVIHKFNRSEGDTTITDTTKVYTQQLFWNATTKKIYSNVDTKVLQKDGWHFGVGFDADEELKNIHFRKYSSEVEFEMSESNDTPESTKPEQNEGAKKGANDSEKRANEKANDRANDRAKTSVGRGSQLSGQEATPRAGQREMERGRAQIEAHTAGSPASKPNSQHSIPTAAVPKSGTTHSEMLRGSETKLSSSISSDIGELSTDTPKTIKDKE